MSGIKNNKRTQIPSVYDQGSLVGNREEYVFVPRGQMALKLPSAEMPISVP